MSNILMMIIIVATASTGSTRRSLPTLPQWLINCTAKYIPRRINTTLFYSSPLMVQPGPARESRMDSRNRQIFLSSIFPPCAAPVVLVA
jgi:hypothetical protein